MQFFSCHINNIVGFGRFNFVDFEMIFFLVHSTLDTLFRLFRLFLVYLSLAVRYLYFTFEWETGNGQRAMSIQHTHLLKNKKCLHNHRAFNLNNCILILKYLLLNYDFVSFCAFFFCIFRSIRSEKEKKIVKCVVWHFLVAIIWFAQLILYYY